jgi:hypothetical protein
MDLIIIAGLRESARRDITFIICESFNNCLINLKNGLIIFYVYRDFTYNVKKIIGIDLINIGLSLIFLSLKNCLSCRVFAIFR